MIYVFYIRGDKYITPLDYKNYEKYVTLLKYSSLNKTLDQFFIFLIKIVVGRVEFN